MRIHVYPAISVASASSTRASKWPPRDRRIRSRAAARAKCRPAAVREWLCDVLFVDGHDPFDLDRAVVEHGGEGADRGEHGGEHGADDADGEREFGDAPAVLFDDHAADVPFMDEPSDRVHELIRRDFERFLE